MSQQYKPLQLSNDLIASNDNNEHGSWSVLEKGKLPSTDFQLLDGRCEFLRNAQLLHGEFTKEGRYDLVKLLYSTHNVFIKGYDLKMIYQMIMGDNLMSIRANNERYINTVEEGEPFVCDIEVVWRADE